MLNLLNQLINFLIKLTGNSKVALPKPVQLSFTKSEPSTGATNKPPIIIFHGIFSCKEHWFVFCFVFLLSFSFFSFHKF